MSVRAHHVRNRVAGLLLVTTLVVAVACGSDSDTSSGDGPAPGNATPTYDGPGPAPRPLPTRTDVTIIVPVAAEAFSPVMVADATGEFEAENLNATVEVISDPQAGLAALTTDRADMLAFGLSASTFNAVNSGIDLRFVSGIHELPEASEEGLYVREEFLTSDGELDPSKVKGMKIAHSGGAGSSINLPMDKALQEVGLSLADVELVQIGFPDMPVALEQGSVDGAYMLTPFWSQPSVAECCELVTVLPPFTSSIYVFTAERLEDDRDTAKAILRALMRTNRTYLQGDYHADDEVMAIISEATGTPVENLRSQPSMVFDPNMGFPHDIEGHQELWLRLGDVLEYDEAITDEQIVDRSVVEEILSEDR